MYSSSEPTRYSMLSTLTLRKAKVKLESTKTFLKSKTWSLTTIQRAAVKIKIYQAKCKNSAISNWTENEFQTMTSCITWDKLWETIMIFALNTDKRMHYNMLPVLSTKSIKITSSNSTVITNTSNNLCLKWSWNWLDSVIWMMQLAEVCYNKATNS